MRMMTTTRAAAGASLQAVAVSLRLVLQLGVAVAATMTTMMMTAGAIVGAAAESQGQQVASWLQLALGCQRAAAAYPVVICLLLQHQQERTAAGMTMTMIPRLTAAVEAAAGGQVLLALAPAPGQASQRLQPPTLAMTMMAATRLALERAQSRSLAPPLLLQVLQEG